MIEGRASELGVSWRDHCQVRFGHDEPVVSSGGLYFHPECPWVAKLSPDQEAALDRLEEAAAESLRPLIEQNPPPESLR